MMPRKKKQTERKTYIALVLDSSGSMSSVRDDTIGGYNTNLEQIKANADLGGETRVSLFMFGEAPTSQPRVAFHDELPSEVAPLTPASYVPSGVTPLLDAMGLALSTLQQKDVSGQDVAFLVTVFTDGYENASREWDGDRVRTLVRTLQAKGNWTITLIGANVDLDAISQQTGILRDQTISYTPDSHGTQNAMAANAAASSSYLAARAGGARLVASMFGGAQQADDEAVEEMGAVAAAAISNARSKK